MTKNFVFCLFLLTEIGADVWEKDVTSEMKIGLAETGYKRVDLRCGAESFFVNVTLNNDFEGVVYTRGSFNNKPGSCFKSHKQGAHLGNKSFLITMNIPFDECQTIMDAAESCYTNTLIVQHDPDFIMPGDAAFALDCYFTPEFKMTTGVVVEPKHRSKITLVDADPASDARTVDEKYRAGSSGDTVTFFPAEERPKDEL